MNIQVGSVGKSTKRASTFKVGEKVSFSVLCIVMCTRREVTLLSAYILHMVHSVLGTLFPSLYTLVITKLVKFRNSNSIIS